VLSHQTFFAEENTGIGSLPDRIAWGGFTIALLALAIVSFFTSMTGFSQLVPAHTAVIAALGLQLTMIASAYFFARASRRRVYWFLSFATTTIVSIAFSYIGIRGILTQHIAPIQNAIFERDQFQKERQRFGSDALRLAGAASRFWTEVSTKDRAAIRVAHANEGARRLEFQRAIDEAGSLQKQLRDRSLREDEVKQLKARLSVVKRTAERASTNREAAHLTATTLEEEKMESDRAVQAIKKTIENANLATPLPGKISESDWVALEQTYNVIALALNSLPQEFRALHNDSWLAPPRRPIVGSAGEILQGQDHPIIEAFAALRSPTPRDWFSLLVAIVFDLIALLALLGTRDHRRPPLHAKIGALRRWMVQVSSQLEAMDGIAPWTARSVASFLLLGASSSREAHVLDFQRRLRSFRDSIWENPDIGALPEGAKEELRKHLTHLFSQIEIITFSSQQRFTKETLATLQACLDSIELTNCMPESQENLKTHLLEYFEHINSLCRSYTVTGGESNNSSNPERMSQN
jgi:hypothetical protein